jgi:hypothetical protein
MDWMEISSWQQEQLCLINRQGDYKNCNYAEICIDLVGSIIFIIYF